MFKRFKLKSPVEKCIFSSLSILSSSGVTKLSLKLLDFIPECLCRQSQNMFLLFGKIISMREDSKLLDLLTWGSDRNFKFRLLQIKKTVPPWEL